MLPRRAWNKTHTLFVIVYYCIVVVPSRAVLICYNPFTQVTSLLPRIDLVLTPDKSVTLYYEPKYVWTSSTPNTKTTTQMFCSNMPQFSNNQQKQQRRIFRGRGGPTDGNIPPKKVVRHKVKYQQEEKIEVVDEELGAASASVNINNLSPDENISSSKVPSQIITTPTTDESKLQLELQHLRKRIQNIQLSIQTSHGLANPKKWRTNCLLPTKNVVKEWHSILKFYHNSSSSDKIVNHTNTNERRIEESEDALSIVHHNSTEDENNSIAEVFHSTSQQVFGLIQMSMQTGPLMGSNPGYFKRCGGDVASIAYEYLNEILELAGKGVNNSVEVGPGTSKEGVTDSCGNDNAQAGQSIQEEGEGGVAGSDESILSNEECSSSSTTHDDDIENNIQSPLDVSDAKTTPSNNIAQEKESIVHNLQTNLIFTEKQSQRFYQWIRNAEKAKDMNKSPTKSAVRLQNQKSKKQTQKELKVERKLKKKGKGRVI